MMGGPAAPRRLIGAHYRERVNLFEFEGRRPTVHPEAFVAPTATLIGDVVVEKGASVWYGAVLRADICRIVVREGANVQDNSVIHAGPDQVAEIGAGATVAHTCIVHGAVIEERGLLGNGSTLLDGARLGAGSMVAAGSMVSPGTQIPAGVLAAGSPATVRKQIEGTAAQQWVDGNPSYYAELAQRHRAGVAPVTE
jgi:carbonic anhydrase/acetyltransferase-like protein (isoleucine patch superfamily)